MRNQSGLIQSELKVAFRLKHFFLSNFFVKEGKSFRLENRWTGGKVIRGICETGRKIPVTGAQSSGLKESAFQTGTGRTHSGKVWANGLRFRSPARRNSGAATPRRNFTAASGASEKIGRPRRFKRSSMDCLVSALPKLGAV